ncbi:MAG: chemotaxis protein CheW, partial [Candidatus Deferrimicrobiaceae bacterium]
MESRGGISPLDDVREELLREASADAEASGREKAREEAGPARSLLVFSVGAEGYAVDLVHVRKVLRPAPIARVSGASPEVL